MPFFLFLVEFQSSSRNTSLRTHLGSSVTLDCHFALAPSSSLSSLEWKRQYQGSGRSLFRYQVGSTGPEAQPKVHVDVAELLGSGDASLSLEGVSVGDEGTYICLVSTPLHQTQHIIQLHVVGEEGKCPGATGVPGTKTLPCTLTPSLPTLIFTGSSTSLPCGWGHLYSTNNKSIPSLPPPAPPRVRVIPSVVAFERGVTTTLTCSIAGYYPLDVSVSWTQKTPQDDMEIPLSNARFSSHRQSRDGTYSITSYLSISSATTRAPATYSCHVSHVTLSEPISVSAHLKAPGSGRCQGQRREFFILLRPPPTSSTHHRDQKL